MTAEENIKLIAGSFISYWEKHMGADFNTHYAAIREKHSYKEDFISSGETYLEATLRYLYMKGAEYQVSHLLFGTQKKRPGAFDVFVSPDEIFEQRYRTNLPGHLDILLQELSDSAGEFSKNRAGESIESDEGLKGLLINALQTGYDEAESGKIALCGYKDYQNSRMLTVNEIRSVAMDTYISIMKEKGFEFEQSSVTRENWYQLKGRDEKGIDFVALFDACIYPAEPGFSNREKQILYREAKKIKADPREIRIMLRSADNEHFRDGVMLWGDPAQMRII